MNPGIEEIEFRHLRYFVAVAEELNFTRAAQKLNIAQPPLSQQISKLEGHLGVKLFIRSKPQIELTNAGKILLGEAQQILVKVEKAIQNTRWTGQGLIGSLSVGYVGSASFFVLPGILRYLKDHYPHIELELIELETDEQVEQLLKHRIDVGLLRSPVTERRLNIKVIMQEPMRLVLPENHPLGDKPGLSIHDLEKEPFIMLPHRLAPNPFNQLMAMFRQAGYAPKISQEALQIQTILNLVAAGMGISFVPASVENIKRTDIIYRSLKEPTPVMEMAVAWNPNNYTPVVDTFLKTIEATGPFNGNF